MSINQMLPAAFAEPFLEAASRVWPKELMTADQVALMDGRKNGRLRDCLVMAWGSMPAELRVCAIARAFPLPVFPVDMPAVPELTALKHVVLERERFAPVALGSNHLYVATESPWLTTNIQTAASREGVNQKLTFREVVVGIGSPAAVDQIISRIKINQMQQSKGANESVELLAGRNENEKILDLSDDQAVNEVLRPVLEYAVAAGATDVHFQPDLDPGSRQIFLRERVRANNELHDFPSLERRDGRKWSEVLKNFFVNLCKVPERAQMVDGKFKLKVRKPGYAQPILVDVRFSSMRCALGFNSSLRLQDRDKQLPGYTELYRYAPEVGRWTTTFMGLPSGIMLICGATGSGKTTTLATILGELPSNEENVMTVEDPVEYELPGISQYPLDLLRIGLDEKANPWLEALRTILRKDPDVIMVGEVRDREVAELLVQAAVSGHQVYSTMHVESVLNLHERLSGLKIDIEQMSYSIKLVTAQRMVRKLCRCATTVNADDDAEIRHYLAENNLPLEWAKEIHEGRCRPRRATTNSSCPNCGGKGYHGLIVAMEGLDYTDPAFRTLQREYTEKNHRVPTLAVEDFAWRHHWPMLPICVLRMIFDGVIDASSASQAVDYRQAVLRLNRDFDSKVDHSWFITRA